MRSIGRGIRIALLIVCAAIFLAGGAMLIRILIGYSEAEGTYESINEGFETLGTLEGNGENIEGDGIHVLELDGLTQEMQSQYDYLMSLKATYPDVVGFVSVPALDIHYPVVQAADNDYYLNHLITGEESASGSVFLDYRCQPDPRVAKNTVLYGHNMNNGSMFHNVEKAFVRETFVSATVEYITEEGVFIYKPLTVFRADAYERFWMPVFGDDQAYLEFCDEMVARSRFNAESNAVEFDADSTVVTLVTCTNSITNANDRFVYQAVLERVYRPTAEE